MAVVPGIVLGGTAVPTDSNDTYPVTDPQWGLGGLRTVANDAELFAISNDRCQEGMMIYVQNSALNSGEPATYQLNPGFSNPLVANDFALVFNTHELQLTNYPNADAPSAALAFPAAPGNVDNGDHSYVVTYTTSTGGETSAVPGNLSNTITVTNKTVNGQVVVTLPDPIPVWVDGINLYRDFNGDLIFLIVEEAIPFAPTYTDNIANSSLGVQVPSLNHSAGLDIGGYSQNDLLDTFPATLISPSVSDRTALTITPNNASSGTFDSNLIDVNSYNDNVLTSVLRTDRYGQTTITSNDVVVVGGNASVLTVIPGNLGDNGVQDVANYSGIAVSSGTTVDLGTNGSGNVMSSLSSIRLPQITYTGSGGIEVDNIATLLINGPPIDGSSGGISFGSELLSLEVQTGSSYFGGRVLTTRGSDVASTNNITLPNNGNYWVVNGTTQINLIDNTGWYPGSFFYLSFSGSLTIKNNQSPTGNFSPILITGGDLAVTSSSLVKGFYDYQGNFRLSLF